MITATTTGKTTTYSVPELGPVAMVRYQGGWIVRRTWSPEEFDTQRVATREYAEALALRHAEALA